MPTVAFGHDVLNTTQARLTGSGDMTPKAAFALPILLLAAPASAAAPLPRVTGSMYDGNNVEPPRLVEPADQAAVTQTDRGKGTNQAKPSDDRNAAQGGAG